MYNFQVGATLQILGVAAGLSALSSLASRLQMVHGRVQQLQGGLGRLPQTLTAVGSVMASIGITIGLGLADAVKQAAALEMALVKVQIATHATDAQMQSFTATAARVANQTIFSMTQIASMAKEMAAAGIRGEPNVQSLLPLFGQAAEVLYRIKGISPTETAHVLSALAHQFGAYTPQAMEPIVQTAVALALQTPATLRQLATMGGYVNFTGSQLYGLKPKDLLILEAALTQLSGGGGAGGRGPASGAALAAALGRLTPGVFGAGLLTGRSAFALRTMGFTNAQDISTVFPGGKLSIPAFMAHVTQVLSRTQTLAGQKQLADAMVRAAQQTGDVKALRQMAPWIADIRSGTMIPGGGLAQLLFSWAFGTTGSRIASIVSAPQFQQNVAGIRGFVDTTPPISAQQLKLINTVQGSWGQLITNLNIATALFAKSSLPTVMHFIQFLNRIVEGFINLELHSPRTVEMIFNIVAGFAAFLTIGGLLLPAIGAVALVLGTGPLGLTAILVALVPLVAGFVAALRLLFGIKPQAPPAPPPHAPVLTPDQAQATSDWLRTHPGQPLTQGVIDQIVRLHSGKVNTYGPSVIPPNLSQPAIIPGGAIRPATPSSSVPALRNVPRPPAARPGEGGTSLVINGGITINGQVDDPRTVQKLLTAIVTQLHRAGIATSLAGGSLESPFVHASTHA